MVNIYDISDTDPADILGNDILDADSIILDPEEVHDRLRSVPLDRFISTQSTSQTSSSSHADDSTSFQEESSSSSPSQTSDSDR